MICCKFTRRNPYLAGFGWRRTLTPDPGTLVAGHADPELRTARTAQNAGIVCGSRTCKPNSVRLAAGRSFLWAAHYCAAQATYPEVVARRADTLSCETEASQEIPPYLVLLRVGFALPAALLRRRCALTAPFHPYLSLAARAVCFLWHFPSSDPTHKSAGALPDVIRHTALRSSDFPPASSEDDASDRPVRLPTHSL